MSSLLRLAPGVIRDIADQSEGRFVPLLRHLREVVPRPVRRLALRALPVTLRNDVQKRLKPPQPPREIDSAAIEAVASPLSVRTANLDRVVAALEAAEVPYFRVQPLHWQSSVLG